MIFSREVKGELMKIKRIKHEYQFCPLFTCMQSHSHTHVQVYAYPTLSTVTCIKYIAIYITSCIMGHYPHFPLPHYKIKWMERKCHNFYFLFLWWNRVCWKPVLIVYKDTNGCHFSAALGRGGVILVWYLFLKNSKSFTILIQMHIGIYRYTIKQTRNTKTHTQHS